jgi:4-alpha-glucanotransferase
VYYWKFAQYLFYQQWGKLKEYAKLFGVGLIGDIPFYVSADSSDVWANRKLFWFDDDHKPSCFAGCPPDSFSEAGQFWGNPVYDWEYMKEDGYGWWVSRIEYMSRMFDMIRVDHFRGFEAFYSISRKTGNPADGQWNKGPGGAFFDVVRQKLGDVSMIAEDLGFLTPEVRDMREASGYPGMKVLQFAFDSREGSDYLPHNYERDDVVYTGTHDNTTLAGWFEEAPEQDVRRAVEYAALTEEEGYCWGMLRLMYGSVAWLAIAQLQDFLELPGSARMNTPSTMGINWKWRVGADYDKPGLSERIIRMVKGYGRH